MADQYSKKFRLYRLSDFKSLPSMRWFIKPIVPRYGVTLLFGEPKTGKKTFVGLSMACAIAAGIAWCGFPTIKGKVLYICGEGFFGVLRRVKAWEKLHGVETGDNLRLLRVPINFFDEPDVNNALMALKIQGFEPDFVVIDTLARSMSGGKENATEDMSQVFEHMDYFRAELLRGQVQDLWTDTGVVIIHHTGKEGIDYRGSSVIKGAVDAMIMVKSDIGSLDITLTSKGYKDAADFATITVRCETAEVETEDGPEQVLAVKGDPVATPEGETKEDGASKRAANEAELDEVLWITALKLSRPPLRLIQYTAWFELTKAERGGKLGTETFSKAVKRQLEMGQVQKVGDFYQVVLGGPAGAETEAASGTTTPTSASTSTSASPPLRGGEVPEVRSKTSGSTSGSSEVTSTGSGNGRKSPRPEPPLDKAEEALRHATKKPPGMV